MVVNWKNGGHFTRFKSKNKAKNSYNHRKNSKKTTQRATSAIWRIFVELDKPKRALSMMNLTSMDRWRLACFSYVFKVGIILNE